MAYLSNKFDLYVFLVILILLFFKEINMILENILETLKKLNINYDLIEHEATTSCEHSKELREKAWLVWIWSKNIIFHAKWNFYLVTTTWEKDIKARKFKWEFWTKDIRFASQEEINNIKMWTIWSISPFWFENNEIKMYVDSEIFENEFFMFNPWVPEKTIRVKTADLKNIYMNLKNEIKTFKLSEEEIEFNEL